MKNGKFEIEMTMGGGNALLENHKLIGLGELEKIEAHAIARCKGSKYPAYIQREDVEAVIEELAQKRLYEPFQPSEEWVNNNTDASGNCFSDADPGL